MGWLFRLGVAAGVGAAVAAVGAAARSRTAPRPARRVAYDEARVKVLILGGGFGGLYTARELRRDLSQKPADREAGVAIRLVDRSDSLTFWPMVPEVIPGSIQAPHVLRPLREELTPLGVEFIRADVQGGDLEHSLVHTDAGEMRFDHLVIALGWTTSFFGTPGADEHCLTLQSLADAVRIRERVVDQFEAAAAGRPHDLRFAVVGGGSTGVEAAAGLADLIDVLLPQYPDLSEKSLRLVLLQAKDDVLPHMEEPLRQAAAARLRRERIELHTDSQVKSVDGAGVVLESGERIEAGTVIWTAGVESSPTARELKGAPLDGHGRIEVDQYLQLKGRPGQYALGDIASVQSAGRPVAPTAQAAVQEAAVVARNLAAQFSGDQLQQFHYRKLGQLVELGGRFAVSETFGIRASGLIGQALWRGVYLYQLAGWRDRLHVLADWTIRIVERPSVPRLSVR